MTEKEKMLKGKIYNANYDKQLIEEREKAKELCYDYNQLRPSKINERKAILKKMLGKTKEKFLIEQPFICDYGYNIEIGENFYSNHNLTILDGNKVKFGDNVFIGPNCGFYTAGHPLDVEERNKGLEYAKTITVGNNVWFGGNVVVLPGVKIGDNVVIGAGSVVTKDIPSNVVAVGNPCKVIKETYYVYMLRCEDNSIYTGITNNIENRMEEHFGKDKKAAKYTKSHTPKKLECVWQTENKSLASKLEYHIKTLTKKQKEQLIKNGKLEEFLSDKIEIKKYVILRSYLKQITLKL